MSLAELLVVMLTMTVVMLAIFGLLDSAIKTAPRDQERALSIREGQAGLHIMTRELRQANKVWTPGKTQIYVNIGDDTHVLYDCDVPHPDDPTQRQCLRWEAAVGAELPLESPGEVVVERRLPGDVFTYEPNLITPTYGVLAALIGVYLGWVWLASGNLLAPVVAHALYDFVALVVLVRGPKWSDVPDVVAEQVD